MSQDCFKNPLPHIVVVGAGAGGLPLATRLGNQLGKKKKAQITLINPSLTSLWKPLWHEVAAGTLSTQEDDINLVTHAYNHGFHFLLGSLESINRATKQLFLSALRDDKGKTILEKRYLHYTFLVIAIGSITADFGVKGVKEHCFSLDRVSDAQAFQQQFLKQFITSQNPQDSQRENPVKIAIVGAGATGVELAAELCFAANQASDYRFAKTQSKKIVDITLIEAGNTILKGLPYKIVLKIEKELNQKGVKIFTDTKVIKVNSEGLATSKEFISADLKIWTAGIKAPDVLSHLDGLETNKIGQLIVNKTLQTTFDGSVFALGDCAACPQNEKEMPVPPRAQAAQQQAILLAKSLVNYVRGKPLLSYVYRDYGTFISLSEDTVMGNVKIKQGGHYFLKGFLAAFSYRFLYRRYQAILHGWWRVVLLIIANRLSKSIRPRLKLH
jgi:NADH dehydrogenase